MGNLCSIFHLRFKNLIKVIPSTRKAQLMDYILLGWQTSTYTLKNSDQKWFMKPHDEIVEDTGIPKSSLERYLKELNNDGFIERRQALYSRTNEDGKFEVKKGSYIYVTEKLICLLKPPISKIGPTDTEDTPKQQPINPSEPDKFNSECNDLNKNEGIDPLNMRESYIRDLYSSFSINNIIFKKQTCSVDKSTLQRLTHQFKKIQSFLYAEIKEEIPEEIKKLTLGTFFNLIFDHRKNITSPEQLVAEYLFALLNVDFYFPKVTCFRHRNNILSKMIRTNTWRTPKGFYKHFYLGQNFKDQQELREQRWKNQKDKESNSPYQHNEEQQDKQLIELENQMFEKSTLIDELTQNIYKQSNEEEISMIREHIQRLREELEGLWHQQVIMEQERKLCA